MRVKKNEMNLRKRSRGRKALLLGLVLLLALSPVNWGGVFGGPADGESGAGERRAAAPADADSIWERVYAAETGGAKGGNAGDGSSGDTASGPAITVVGVNVKNTDTLEVGIQVGGPDQPLFQSVGLVLEYDKSRLTPMDWQPGWQTVESQTTNASGEAITTPSTAVVAGQEDWKCLAVYTPTWINSGTAQVYEPGDGTGVGAAGKGYLLLQANTEYPYSLPTARQIVTVKFQYTGDSVGTGGAIVKAGSFDEVGLALAGAEGSGLSAGKKVAYTSRVKHVGLYHTGNAFYYNGALRDDGSGNAEEDPTLSGRKLTVNFSASIVEGETQQAAGGGDLSNAVPVLLFDWDQTTLLGSVTVDRADLDSVDTAVKQYTSTLMSPVNAAAYLEDGYLQPPEGVAETDYIPPSYYDEAYVLNEKKGYTFGKWVNLDSDAGTSYGKAVRTDNNGIIETIPEPEDEQPAMTGGYISLKACYAANQDMAVLNTADYAQRNYTVSFEKGSVFNGTNMSVTVRAERKNAEDAGVHRTREPALRVEMKLDSGVSVYSLVSMDNRDSVTVQIVPNTAVQTVYAEVVDVRGITNWIGNSAARSGRYTLHRDSAGEIRGYKAEAYLGQLCEYAIEGTNTVGSHFTNAEIVLDKVFGTTSTSQATLRRQAMANMLAALRMKNEGKTQTELQANIKETAYLTYKEAMEAIEDGTFRGESIVPYES